VTVVVSGVRQVVADLDRVAEEAQRALPRGSFAMAAGRATSFDHVGAALRLHARDPRADLTTYSIT
jgi:hypothetical protein